MFITQQTALNKQAAGRTFSLPLMNYYSYDDFAFFTIIISPRDLFKSALHNNIRITYKRYIAHSVSFVDTAFSKTGLRKQIQTDVMTYILLPFLIDFIILLC